MKWFRLYTEIKDDPKMLELDDHQFRVWINLLSMAGESEERGVIPAARPRGLAAALHTAPEDMETAFLLFTELGMVERREDGSLLIVNFMERQYDNPSDHPEKVAERKTRMKERQQNAPAPSKNAAANHRNETGTTKEREQNAEERTYSDTDLYSDTENTQKRTEEEQDAPNGAAALPPGDNAVKIFIDLFTDKIGEPPDIPPRFTKPLKETMSRVGRDRYRAAICAFLSDGWGSETGYSVQTFVSMPVDRWTRAEPKTPVRASPASKNGAASSAEYYTARIDGILGGPRA